MLDLDVDNDPERAERFLELVVPDRTRQAVYRIAEEALTNVAKHVRASQVGLALKREGTGVLLLRLLYNGTGFAVDSVDRGLGMGTMIDYIEVAGGQLGLTSSVGLGTEVNGVLPI